MVIVALLTAGIVAAQIVARKALDRTPALRDLAGLQASGCHIGA